MKLFGATCCLCVLLLSLVAVALTPRSHATAASGRVTHGDVEAILHASFSGGAILFHEHSVRGFEDFPRGAITPLSSNTGTHYCVDDWHVVRITVINSVDNILIFTKQQAIAELEATTVTLTVDSVALPTVRTPITMLNAADQQRFDFPGTTVRFQTGSILSPAALGAGGHTAGLVVTNPQFGAFQDSSAILVDPSGTGACLQS